MDSSSLFKDMKEKPDFMTDLKHQKNSPTLMNDKKQNTKNQAVKEEKNDDILSISLNNEAYHGKLASANHGNMTKEQEKEEMEVKKESDSSSHLFHHIEYASYSLWRRQEEEKFGAGKDSKYDEKGVDALSYVINSLRDAREDDSSSYLKKEMNGEEECCGILDYNELKLVASNPKANDSIKASRIAKAVEDLILEVRSNSWQLEKIEPRFDEENAKIVGQGEIIKVSDKKENVRIIEEKLSTKTANHNNSTIKTNDWEPQSIRPRFDEENAKIFEQQNSRKTLERYKLIQIMGRGSYGLVLKLRNQKNAVIALKLFEKKRAQAFFNETSVLQMLRDLDTEGEVGLEETIETTKYYGLVMGAGIGTLFDFKCFLQKQHQELNEKELLMIFGVLLTEFNELLSIRFCHRDIKPRNIVIVSKFNELTFELIDFGSAVCFFPEAKISGLIGTTCGYIAPHILKKRNNLSAADLLLGDLFSLGITLLEIAIPDFVSSQNDIINNAKNAMKKLANGKPSIYKLLNVLLFNNNALSSENVFDDKISKIVKLLGDFYENLNEEAENPLQFYYNHFMEYLLKKDKEQRETNNPEALEVLNTKSFEIVDVKSNSDKIISDADDLYIAALEENFSIGKLEKAASLYKEVNNGKKVLVCYENIVKSSIQEKDFQISAIFCDKIWALFQAGTFDCHPFLFSTVGIGYYLKGDISKAKKMFQEGLQYFSDSLARIVLCNNYGCTLFKEGNRQESKHYFQKAHDLITKEFPDFYYFIINKVLTTKFSNIGSTSLHVVKIEKEDNLFELMLTLGKFEPQMEDQNFTLDLISNTFFDFCLDKACCMTSSLDERDHKEFLLKMEKFVCYFNQKNTTIMRLSEHLEILVSMLEFGELLSSELGEDLSSVDGLTHLKKISDFLTKEKDGFYIKFKEQKISALFEDQSLIELFSTMMGFVFQLQNKKSNKIWPIKDLVVKKLMFMKELTDSVELTTITRNKGKFYEKPFPEAMPKHFASIITNYERDLILNPRQESSSHQLSIPEVLLPYVLSYGYQVMLNKSKNVGQASWSLYYLKLVADYPNDDYSKKIESLLAQERDYSRQFFINLERLEILNLLVLDLSITRFAPANDDDMWLVAECLVDLVVEKPLRCFKLSLEWSYIAIGGIYPFEAAILTIAEFGDPNNLKELHFEFTSCPNIADDSILSLAQAISKNLELTSITFGFCGCGKITIQGVKKLDELFKTSPSLKSRNIWIKPMTHDFFQAKIFSQRLNETIHLLAGEKQKSI